ncbi:MAG TPA: hypothetical protein VKA18_06435 [Alphaproteobacteria bacterium]|nr:hypothetical protein [Alphaproteobacteria bacterium]
MEENEKKERNFHADDFFRFYVILLANIGLVGAQMQTADYPKGYQAKFDCYQVADKAERKITRFPYLNPSAWEATASGEALPNGSVVIMEDHQARLGADALLRMPQGRGRSRLHVVHVLRSSEAG